MGALDVPYSTDPSILVDVNTPGDGTAVKDLVKYIRRNAQAIMVIANAETSALAFR